MSGGYGGSQGFGGYGNQGFGGYQGGFGQGFGGFGKSYGGFNQGGWPSFNPQGFGANNGMEQGQLGGGGWKINSFAKPGFEFNPYPSGQLPGQPPVTPPPGQVPPPTQPPVQPPPSYPPVPQKPPITNPPPAAPPPTQPPAFNPAPPQPTQAMQPGQNSWGWTADNTYTPMFDPAQLKYITHMTRGAYNGQTAPWLSQLDNNNMIQSIGQLSGVQFDANDPRWR